ncbi:hypothetical protein P4631_09245 [Halalkalibacterium halodurans]|uniref:hypothetical protein n=1 Tax=Halalkalibacterium halodurans TaxID=86665 RepID=UPI002E233D01|nr:hypothetical protein [Halalkalibacterium halodurans]
MKKFPVTGNLGEYQVEITESYVTLGLWQWKVELYVERESPLLSMFRFKRVYTWESGWWDYDDWIGKFVGLAREVVEEYEFKTTENRRKLVAYEKGVEEFYAWDGDARREDG